MFMASSTPPTKQHESIFEIDKKEGRGGEGEEEMRSHRSAAAGPAERQTGDEGGARMWWMGDMASGGGDGGQGLAAVTAQWGMRREARRAKVEKSAACGRWLAEGASNQVGMVLGGGSAADRAQIEARRLRNLRKGQHMRQQGKGHFRSEMDEDAEEEMELAKGNQDARPLLLGLKRLEIEGDLGCDDDDGDDDGDDSDDVGVGGRGQSAHRRGQAGPRGEAGMRAGAAAHQAAKGGGGSSGRVGRGKEGEDEFRLKKRRAELYRTEVSTINSMIDLIEKLEALSLGMVFPASMPGSDRTRKRDIVRDAVGSVAHALVGGSLWNSGGGAGGSASSRQASGGDPYARMSLPRAVDEARLGSGNSECSIGSGSSGGGGGLGTQEHALYDMRLIEQTMVAVRGLISVHDQLRQSMERACVQDSLDPLWPAFRQQGTALEQWHLDYSKVSGPAGMMLRHRDPSNAHDWGDLLARPTQRVMKYQLFFDELSRDARSAGFLIDGGELEGLAALIRRVLDCIDEGKMRFECSQTVRQIISDSQPAGLPEGVEGILKQQEHVVCACAAAQASSTGGKGGMVDRLVLLFDRCLVILDPAGGLLRLVECVQLARLDPSRCGELRHIPAMSLEVIRRYHQKMAPEVMSEFEVEHRIFSAKAAVSREFRDKMSQALQLEMTGQAC